MMNKLCKYKVIYKGQKWKAKYFWSNRLTQIQIFIAQNKIKFHISLKVIQYTYKHIYIYIYIYPSTLK